MIRREQEVYGYGDYLTGSLSSVFEDYPQRDMLGSQFWPVDGVEKHSEVQYESSHTNASVDASILVPLANHFEVENYNSLIGSAGLQYTDTPMAMPLKNHWTREDISTSNITCMNTEWQQSEHNRVLLPPRPVTNNNAKNIHSEFHGKMAVPTSSSFRTSSTSLSKKPKPSSKEIVPVQNRQFIAAERLRALQELLPATLKVNQDSVQANRESVLDNVVGYIKHLEHQLKDMSGSRLGDESISTPLFYVEGLGHYYHHPTHGQKFEESVEEVFGKLMEENPRIAKQLLESKGLHMVPIDSIDALWSRADSDLV